MGDKQIIFCFFVFYCNEAGSESENLWRLATLATDQENRKHTSVSATFWCCADVLM